MGLWNSIELHGPLRLLKKRMRNTRQFITLAFVALIAAGIGWLLGNRQDEGTNEDLARRTGNDQGELYHSNGDVEHSHSPSDHHSHGDEGHHHGVSPTAEKDVEDQTPEPPANPLERAIATKEHIREENETILRELLSADEVRDLYREKLETPDLSLYDDEGNRLSEEEFVAKWTSDHGIKTPEMEASMEAAAWAPVENALAKTGSLNEGSDLADSESAETRLSPAEEEERRREIRQQEAETIRAELLTRAQIEALYEQKVSENSPEVFFPGGGRVTKDEFVRMFIETHGELTPELNQVLNEYGSR